MLHFKQVQTKTLGNLVIRHITNDIIDIYSYNANILEVRGNNIYLNTKYFNYSPTTSNHFTKSLSKIFSDKLVSLDKIITGYNKIKKYLKSNPYNSERYGNPSMLQFQLKSYINSLGYHFKVDTLTDSIWLVIQTNC